jgi:LppP/LprE lipoprotein
MHLGRPTALCATLLAAGALSAGCGSGTTTTVTAPNSPPPSTTPSKTSTSAEKTTTTGQGASETSSTPSTTDSGGASAGGETRTAPEPAFTGGETAAGASAAVAVLRARGYTALDPAQYHSTATLGVLIGRGDGDEGGGEQAFFFVGGRFIGTDAKEPSASVELVSESDSEVTLAYPLYRSGDAAGAPTGGRALVRFQLDDGKLQALSAIPPANPGASLSRR